MQELSEEIGNLKYGALNNFLDLLAEKIKKDAERKRVKLAKHLQKCAENLQEAKQEIEKAWIICEPYTK